MSWWKEQAVYADHVRGLFEPNHIGAVHQAHALEPGDMQAWPESELDFLIEEGRRQHDRLTDELERVRGRAQVLLAMALALLAALGSLVGPIHEDGAVGAWILWGAALASGGWAALGTGATATVSANMETIDSTALSQYNPPLKLRLADDYAAINVMNFNSVAARLTNSRIAVGWLLVAAMLGLGTWVWIRV